ncbi:hypothetical protein [Embleya scabrispora]|uniref:hypothetical protein n=1 Tax=Embleya scabrispora TaxID=159449 RepID=UPI00037A4925|nr:hypothetical protein [Embleya scabrispora]MYS85288.1 hypothetical protein [Streptomyces sp. SID5474]
MSYGVESTYTVQRWLKGQPAHVNSAYDDMTRRLASDPWRVGSPTRSNNMREYAFCVEGTATFIIEDRCVTVTIVQIS